MAAWVVPTFFMDWHVLKDTDSDFKVHVGLFSASFMSNPVSLQTLQFGLCEASPSNETIETFDSMSTFMGVPAKETFEKLLLKSNTAMDPCTLAYYWNTYGWIIAVTV